MKEFVTVLQAVTAQEQPSKYVFSKQKRPWAMELLQNVLYGLHPQSLRIHRLRNNYIRESDTRHFPLQYLRATGTENELQLPKQPTNMDFFSIL